MGSIPSPPVFRGMPLFGVECKGMLRLTSNAVSGFSRILRRINAAGLSRVLDHMWKGPFGIISAFVDGGENLGRAGKLKNLLKERGQGFIDLKGGYLYEDEGKPKVPIKEDSVFLPGISEVDLRELSSQFDQESYIFGEGGSWSLKETKSGAVWADGFVADTFEALRKKEVSEDYPFMSQLPARIGRQFRLDPDLVQRRKQEQDELVRQQHAREQGRVAFRLVNSDSPCFYSIAGDFRPRPPVCLAASDIKLSGNCPEGSLLDCWLPLI